MVIPKQGGLHLPLSKTQEAEDEHPRSSVNRQQKLMKSIEKSFKTRDKNSSSSYREKARNSVRMWSTLSNEISSVIQNVKRNIPRLDIQPYFPSAPPSNNYLLLSNFPFLFPSFASVLARSPTNLIRPNCF